MPRCVTQNEPPTPTGRPLDDGHFDESVCLDCGASLTGPHCARCGQAAHAPRTLKALWHDLVIEGVLHLDGKFVKTIAKLVRRPGELTRRYVQGERTRFVSPLGMFLFGFVVLFAAIQVTGVASGPSSADFPGMTLARAELDMREAIGQDPLSAEEPLSGVEEAEAIDDLPGWLRYLPEEERAERLERAKSALFFVEQARIAWDRDDDPEDLEAQVERDGIDTVRTQLGDPAKFAYKIQANGYKFSWALIPILTPFVWLLFVHRRREFGLYDHGAFVTYSLGFASLLGAFTVVLAGLGLGFAWTGPLFFLPYIAHNAVQFRGAYGLSWWGAIWRTGILQIFAQVAIFLFLLLLSGIALVG